MVKKIAVDIKRQWLKSYEKGTSQQKLAIENNRDVRTIKRAIEDARRERNMNRAYEDMLKEALHDHQHDLIHLLTELKKVFVPFSHFETIPYGISDFDYFLIPDGKAYYEMTPQAEITAVKLDVEENDLWPFLEEHLKSDPFKKSFGKWKQSLATILESLIVLKRKMASLLQAKTGYKVRDIHTASPILLDTGIDHLFNYVCIYALGLIGFSEVKDNIHAEPETGQVKYGKGTTLALCPGKEETCKDNIIGAINELLTTTEKNTYFSNRLAHKEYVQKVKKDVDEILMTRIVPGHCQVCRRLGL